MGYRKTPVVARELGTNYFRLMSLFRLGKLQPPTKDSSGDYQWSDEDVEKAREVIEQLDQRRRRPNVEPVAIG